MKNQQNWTKLNKIEQNQKNQQIEQNWTKLNKIEQIEQNWINWTKLNKIKKSYLTNNYNNETWNIFKKNI